VLSDEFRMDVGSAWFDRGVGLMTALDDSALDIDWRDPDAGPDEPDEQSKAEAAYQAWSRAELDRPALAARTSRAPT